MDPSWVIYIQPVVFSPDYWCRENSVSRQVEAANAKDLETLGALIREMDVSEI